MRRCGSCSTPRTATPATRSPTCVTWPAATLAASSAIPASVTAEIDDRPAPAIETIAYFCAAELIANATKHSYANQIKINIFTERAGVLRLEVTDDGIGGADQGRGSGLSGLGQRVSTVDGRIDVSS